MIEQGNHGVTFTEVPDHVFSSKVLEIRHFPYRSFEQFKRKAINGKKAYDETDLPRATGQHWRQYGEILERYGEDALREVFTTWYWFLAPIEAGMVHDPAPYRRWPGPPR